MELLDLKSAETLEFISQLERLMELIKTAFSQRTPNLNGEKYLTNKDLHVSLRTLQEYRDTGKISYIQISGKILYKESDVLKLYIKNYYPHYSTHIL